MALTHEQMVLEALGNQEITTNQEVQEYIRDFLGAALTTGEISDIRNETESQAEPPFWYQSPKVDPWTDPYWH